MGVSDVYCSEKSQFFEDSAITSKVKRNLELYYNMDIFGNIHDNDTTEYLDFCKSVKILKVNAKSYNLTAEQCGKNFTKTASGKVLNPKDTLKGCSRVVALSSDVEKNLNIQMGSNVYLYGAPHEYNGCYTFDDRMGYKTKSGKIQRKSIDILTKTITDARNFGSKFIYLVYYDNYVYNVLKESTRTKINTLLQSILNKKSIKTSSFS